MNFFVLHYTVLCLLLQFFFEFLLQFICTISSCATSSIWYGVFRIFLGASFQNHIGISSLFLLDKICLNHLRLLPLLHSKILFRLFSLFLPDYVGRKLFSYHCSSSFLLICPHSYCVFQFFYISPHFGYVIISSVASSFLFYSTIFHQWNTIPPLFLPYVFYSLKLMIF